MAKGNKIVLGVDLDEVVFEYLEFIKMRLKEEYGNSRSYSGPATWSLSDSGWFDTEQDFLDFHYNEVENGLYEKLPVIKGARENIVDLFESGYRINVITSRFVSPGQHQKVVKQTAAALDKSGILYSSISFLSDKTLFLADAYIDDSPKNIKALQDEGRFVVTMDMPYNREIKVDNRVSDWTELREVLRNKFGK